MKLKNGLEVEVVACDFCGKQHTTTFFKITNLTYTAVACVECAHKSCEELGIEECEE